MESNKKYLVYAIVLILLVSFILLNQQIINFWYELQVNQTCIEEKTALYSPIENYYRGNITVVFIDNLKSEKIIDIIKIYRLKAGYVSESFAVIEVPIDTEIRWICIFESRNDVKRALLYSVVKENI